MKKFMRCLLVFGLCALFMVSSAFAEGTAPALQLDFSSAVTRTFVNPESSAESTEVVLFKGKTCKLATQLTGLDDTKQAKFSWETSDKQIVTVNGGTIKGLKAGAATVTCTATLPDGTELHTTVPVTVETMITKLTAKNNKPEVNVGETIDPIEITFSPSDATCKELTWESADETIATVDANGRITGVKAGKTKITATSAEKSANPKSVALNLTVLQPVASLALDESNLVLAKGSTAKLAVTIAPEDASSKKCTWDSSDPKVAAVSAGTVTAKGPGAAVITCTAADGSGQAATTTVEVYAPVSSAAMSSKTETLFIGTEGTQLSVTVKPEGAKYYEVTWSSADESIATVDQTGKVTPVSGGKTKISATITNTLLAKPKPITATCTVSVNTAVDFILIDNDKPLLLGKGKTDKLITKVFPETATNKKVIWTSADPKIATVDSTGKVTAKALGFTTITATAADGSGKETTITVSVYQPTTGVSLDTNKLVLTAGETKTLHPTVKPADAEYPGVYWYTSDISVATVDAYGNVTAVSSGQCKISAISEENENKKSSATVIVEPVVPLDATTFTRSGYFGAYYEFAVTFKNLTKTRTVTYIQFDVKYDYNGKTSTYTGFYTDSDRLGPGATRKIGWWDQFGYRLSYYSNFRIYLTAVRYSDGTWDYFTDNNLIGWF